MNGKKNHTKKITHFLLIVVGTFILCMSVQMFIIPFEILSGGVAGIAVAVNPLFHIDPTKLANALTVGLLVLSYFFLGRQFFYSTVLSSLLYPVFNSILASVLVPMELDPMLASFYGGLLGGIGVGLVMRAGASTGGMDIPPLIIHKFTGVKISTLVMCTDLCTVLLGLVTYGLPAVLLGWISVFVSSFAINYILSFGQGTVSKSVQIISNEWEKISKSITDDFDRSATIMDGVGAYSGETRKVVLVVVSNQQYGELIALVNELDPKAFVITTDATDMHGEGFSYAHI